MSPAYLHKCKKDAFAIRRHIGFPSLNYSFHNQLHNQNARITDNLGELVDNKVYINNDTDVID